MAHVTDAEQLAAVAVILKKVYPLFDNDGLVPFDSAAFTGHALPLRVECPGYDHLDMKDSSGQSCANGLRLFQSLHKDLGLEPPPTADFNGDTHPDILLQNTSSGDIYVWYLDGVTITGGAYVFLGANPAWQIVGTADFNADTHPDILLQNTSSGDIYVWYLDGVSITGGAYVYLGGSPAWQIVGPK